MKVEFKKKGDKLFLHMIVIPKTVRESMRRYTTEDIESWLANNKKDIILDKYQLISKPHFVHDGMGESYLSGEWVYESIKEEIKETPQRPAQKTTEPKKTSEPKKAKQVAKAVKKTKAILEQRANSAKQKQDSSDEKTKKLSKVKKVQRV